MKIQQIISLVLMSVSFENVFAVEYDEIIKKFDDELIYKEDTPDEDAKFKELIGLLPEKELKNFINIQDGEGQTLLHRAVYHRRKTIIPKLLKINGITINSKDNNGNTPLHLAVLRGEKEIVKLLCKENSIDINVRNNEGNAPLHLIKNDEDGIVIAKYLLNVENIKKNLKNDTKETPLYKAVANNNEAFVKILLKNRVSVNEKNENGFTPLHKAVFEGNEIIVKDLLESDDIKVDEKNINGYTPLELARKKNLVI